MCVGPFAPKTAKVPDLPPLPPSPPPPPTLLSAGVQDARLKQRRAAAGAAGNQSTFLTGAGGLTTPAMTTGKTLLGS